jgi:DNA damage-binding protein 1
VYDLTHETLVEVAVSRAPITALTISTRPPFILLGDLMKSVTLLRLDSAEGKTEIATVAKDYAPLWMTSAAILEEGWFLGAEDSGNIVGWRRDDDLTPDEARLSMVNEMRFGEMINRIRLGKSPSRQRLITGSLSTSEIPGVETKALFATVDGTIGIVASLSEEKFLPLEAVEKRMEEDDMSLGGLEHTKYFLLHAMLIGGGERLQIHERKP